MTNGNQPVHPTLEQEYNGNYTWATTAGMTLREHFASLICASLVGMGENGYSDYKGNATFAVEQADALIEALNT